MKTFEKVESLGFFDWLAETHNLRDTDMKAEYLDNLPLDDIHRTVVNSMAFRWFREKHDLACYIYRTNFTSYEWVIDIDESYAQDSELDYTSYEKAELACLDKLLEILETKSE